MTRIQLRDMSGHEANIRFQERNEHDPLTGRRYDGRRVSRLGRLAHVAVRTVIT